MNFGEQAGVGGWGLVGRNKGIGRSWRGEKKKRNRNADIKAAVAKRRRPCRCDP